MAIAPIAVNGASFVDSAPAHLAASLPSQAATDTAFATLQGQGASPTEAAVDTADNAWIAYKAALATAVTAQAGQDMLLLYDNTELDTVTKVRNAYRALGDALIARGLMDYR